MNNMKKWTLFALLGIVLTMGSCGNKTQRTYETVSDTTGLDALRDHTIYGICGENTAMNSLQLITDAGDTLQLNLTEADEAGKVLGGLNTGDRMAILANADKTKATLVINLSTLLGNWVMPNPLDGSDEQGVRLLDGGVAEGIEQPYVTYRSWRFFNGRLIIESVREGTGDLTETEEFDVQALGPDTLCIKNDKEQMEYYRQRPKKDYSDIKLEEASSDDYLI